MQNKSCIILHCNTDFPLTDLFGVFGMTSFVENFEKLSDLQKQGLEPVRNFTVFAVDAFEKLARQNYAFCGDVLELAVWQAKLPVDAAEPKELFKRQVASTKAFAELLTDRANQYAELGKNLKDTAANLFEKDSVKPAKKTGQAASKKAA